MKVYTRVVLQLTDNGFVPLEEESYEYSGPLAEAKGGGTNTVTQSEPPGYVQDAQKNLLGQAQNQASSGGSMVAPINADQTAAMDMTREIANNYFKTFGNTAFTQGKDTLGLLMNPSRLDVTNNPYFQGRVNAAVRPIADTFSQTILPGIGQQAVADGSYGGTRHGVAQGIAAGKFAQTAGDITANLAADEYRANQAGMLQATQMSPAFTEMEIANQLRPAQLLTGLGDYGRSLDQSIVSEPWQRLEWLRGFVPGATGMSTTMPSPAGNPLMGALGGGATGYALGSMIGGGATGAAGGATTGASFGPWGALIGAGLGYLASR